MCCLQCEICVGKNREIHFNNFSTVFFCCFARKRKKALHDDSTHTSPLPFIKKLAIVAYRHCFMLHTHTLVAWNFVLFFSKIIFVRFDQFVKYLFVFYLQTTTLHYVECIHFGSDNSEQMCLEIGSLKLKNKKIWCVYTQTLNNGIWIEKLSIFLFVFKLEANICDMKSICLTCGACHTKYLKKVFYSKLSFDLNCHVF